MAGRRALIVGNWKMFGRLADLDEIAALEAVLGAAPEIDVAVCPPFTLLAEAARRFVASPVAVGAQDVTPGGDGAHTGDVNAAMLADAGARLVIVGHSERRRDRGESDATVRAKAAAAMAEGIAAIVCVGETIEERKAGRAVEVVAAQLAGSLPLEAAPGRLIVAYEPVWAIGTGLTPSLAEIAAMHGALRAALPAALAEETRLLYGGSVKPSNAGEIFTVADVDGALVGGASLKAADFSQIIAACAAARQAG